MDHLIAAAWVIVIYLITNSAKNYDPKKTITDVRSIDIEEKTYSPCFTFLFIDSEGELLDIIPADIDIQQTGLDTIFKSCLGALINLSV